MRVNTPLFAQPVVPSRKRYNVSSRLTGVSPAAAGRLEALVAGQPDLTEVKRTRLGRRVVEMSDADARRMQAANPDVIVTEDQPLTLFQPPGYADTLSVSQSDFPIPVVVTDEATGAPLADVTVYGIGSAANYKAITDARGRTTLQSFEKNLSRVVASPRRDHWSRMLTDVDQGAQPELKIALRSLGTSGAYTWGHSLLGFPKVNRRWRGRGVKVAVVDSGIVNDSGDLQAKGGFNTLDGSPPESWNVDEKGHGTHCAGVIACQHNNIGISGGAPDCEVYSLKVFPGGMVSDIIEAIEWSIANNIDVVSLSLGAPSPDPVLEQVLNDAYQRGLTLVAAAGNEGTRVAYPAAYDSVIAVSALGSYGTFPDDSDHMTKVGIERDWTGRLFSATFTNFGPEISVCAPGVAVVSTVPGGYAAWDGTSMACPMISGLVALILEAYPQIRTRTRQQPEMVKAILQASCVNLGMEAVVQGSGLPQADRALGGVS